MKQIPLTKQTLSPSQPAQHCTDTRHKRRENLRFSPQILPFSLYYLSSSTAGAWQWQQWWQSSSQPSPDQVAIPSDLRHQSAHVGMKGTSSVTGDTIALMVALAKWSDNCLPRDRHLPPQPHIPSVSISYVVVRLGRQALPSPNPTTSSIVTANLLSMIKWKVNLNKQAMKNNFQEVQRPLALSEHHDSHQFQFHGGSPAQQPKLDLSLLHRRHPLSAAEAEVAGPPSQGVPPRAMGDTVDKLVVFLAKRDGIDKLVKTFQYVSKLVHWHAEAAHPDVARRAKQWEVASGLSRKAFRTGRFLTGFNALRRGPGATPLFRLLAVFANGGEMVYFFFDHILWLARVGVVDPGLARRMSYISAFGESVGYVFFIIADFVLIRQGMAEERRLRRAVAAGEIKAAEEKLRRIRADRVMRLMAVAANLADLVIGVADIEPNPFCNHAVTLGISGLVSAWAGWYRNWPS
ncbi:hypothetical protein Taro_049912 [Colocasia esculenta]|uniref:Peroxisomal membrane protein 11B n=1 Tax=Colocasia esculenta TaxID=4460 RepID=A0A843XCC4_COLES|nr:hypothetical protein [Colocasia esculenta]